MRICVDLNVWVQDELVQRAGRPPGAASRVIELLKKRGGSGRPLQLVISVQMLDHLKHVLVSRRQADPRWADLYVEAIEDLARMGPEKLDPHLILAGRERFPIRDREDQGVFAVAIIGRVDLLVTANLRDFLTGECEAIETRKVQMGKGRKQLHVQIHQRPDGGSLIIADPIDVIGWLEEGLDINAETIRSRYAGNKRLTER
jgi:predicted nucleic acid-binding protein